MITKLTKSLTIAITILLAIINNTSPAAEGKDKDYCDRSVKLNITNKTKDVPGHVNEHTVVVIQGPTCCKEKMQIMPASAVATDTPNRDAKQPKEIEMTATPKSSSEFNMPITVLVDNRKQLGIPNAILAFYVASIQTHKIAIIQSSIQTDNIKITTKITENVLGMIVVDIEITDDVT